MHKLCSSICFFFLAKLLEAFNKLFDHSNVAVDEVLKDCIDIVKNFHEFHLLLMILRIVFYIVYQILLTVNGFYEILIKIYKNC